MILAKTTNMNQYQNRSTEEQKSFLSRVKDNYKSNFLNLSITSSIQKASSHVDKDGKTETDTLIHKAFVEYYDNNNLPYPDWLGVPQRASDGAGTRNGHSTGNGNGFQSYGRQTSQFQPVYTNYNSPQNETQTQPQQPQPQRQNSGNSQLTYKPRTSSRLQDMYNKSRQQHVPGGAYNSSAVTQQPARTNSSTSGARLRERMMNSSSMTGMNNIINEDKPANGRAQWGRK